MFLHENSVFIKIFSCFIVASEIEATRSRLAILSNLSNDPDINKDALFLDSLTKATQMDTSEIFLGHLRKCQSLYNEDRRSVKKRIESKV